MTPTRVRTNMLHDRQRKSGQLWRGCDRKSPGWPEPGKIRKNRERRNILPELRLVSSLNPNMVLETIRDRNRSAFLNCEE